MTPIRIDEGRLKAQTLPVDFFKVLAFHPAWEEIAAPASLAALRVELDRTASAKGELRLTIPLAYLEARRPPDPGVR